MTKKEEKHEIEKAEPKAQALALLDDAMKFLGVEEYSDEEFQAITRREAREAELASELAAYHGMKAGAALLVAKEQVEHGNWEKWLEQTGLKTRTAQSYMLFAKRAQDKNMLNSNIFKLGLSKAREVLALPQAEIEEILKNEESGEGDPVARMSLRELQEYCRKLKGQNEKNQEKIKKGMEQLDETREQLVKERKEKKEPLTLEKTLMNMLSNAAVCENLDTPDDDADKASVDAVVRSLYEKVRDIYNKFTIKKVVDYEPLSEEKMSELNDEFGDDDEDEQ